MLKTCDYKISAKVDKEYVDDIHKLFTSFHNQGVNIFARDGLLLGAARHGGFLPFDVDPDVGILNTDYKSLKKLKLPENYTLIYQPNYRNLKYYFKNGTPYEFYIIKNRYSSRTRYLFTILFLLSALLVLTLAIFTKYKILILLLPLLFILYYNLMSSGVKMMDGTIFQKTRNDIYNQEVEPNERKVFKQDYGHAGDEMMFKYKKEDILPLKKLQFYHGFISVPNNYEKVLKEHYGEDVFNVMYKKEDGDSKIKINIENCLALPAKII